MLGYSGLHEDFRRPSLPPVSLPYGLLSAAVQGTRQDADDAINGFLFSTLRLSPRQPLVPSRQCGQGTRSTPGLEARRAVHICHSGATPNAGMGVAIGRSTVIALLQEFGLVGRELVPSGSRFADGIAILIPVITDATRGVVPKLREQLMEHTETVLTLPPTRFSLPKTEAGGSRVSSFGLFAPACSNLSSRDLESLTEAASDKSPRQYRRLKKPSLGDARRRTPGQAEARQAETNVGSRRPQTDRGVALSTR